MMSVPAGYYTLDKLLTTLNSYYVNEYDVYFIKLQGGRVGVNFNPYREWVTIQMQIWYANHMPQLTGTNLK